MNEQPTAPDGAGGRARAQDTRDAFGGGEPSEGPHAAASAVGLLCWSTRDAAPRACGQARRLLGWPPARPLAWPGLLRHARRRLGLDLRAWITRAHASRLDSDGELHASLAVTTPEGGTRKLHVLVLNAFDAHGAWQSCNVALHDVTERLALASALSETETRLTETQAMTQVGSWEWQASRATVQYSPEALRLFGLEPGAELPIDKLAQLAPKDQFESIQASYRAVIAQRQPALRYEFTCLSSGSPREYQCRVKFEYDARGRPKRVLGTIQDVTELKQTRRQLHSLSHFDPVTSLPNQLLLSGRMQALALAAPPGAAGFGVLAIGLERHEPVQDSLGLAAGDELLRQVGARLSGVLRSTDTLARLSTDQFAVLLPEVTQASEITRVGDKLLQALGTVFVIEGHEITLGASAGAALFPSDASDAGQLLQHAVTALSHARARGGGQLALYAPQLTEQAAERLRLESDLRRGLERDELVLHYQPQYELGSGRLLGAEALMRWRHPERGLVPPLSFIPLAEDTGLIVRMGEWALHQACAAATRWNHGRATPLKVAVNLSARQFGDGRLVHTVTQALHGAGCRPQWLELEITESLLLDGRDDIRQALDTLASLGVTIALDDFGTGYSALSYLTRLPVHTLKIDRSFVAGLPHDRNGGELARAIVSLGQGLGMTLVAEGVETQAQADFLRGLGCQQAQGFLLGRPMEAEAFDALL